MTEPTAGSPRNEEGIEHSVASPTEPEDVGARELDVRGAVVSSSSASASASAMTVSATSGDGTSNPVYATDENKLAILRLGYENQIQYLRMMSDVDLRLFTGYITVQLVLANWLASRQAQPPTVNLGIMLVDLVVAALAIKAFWVNQTRREYAVKVLEKLSKALGFTVVGAFLPEQCIQDRVPTRPWFPYYVVSVVVAFIGVATVLLGL